MMTAESWVLSYLVNSLWQIPLLFAAGWMAARTVMHLGPAAEHRVWVTVLLLQGLLPAAVLLPWEGLRNFLAWGGPSGTSGSGVSIVMGPGNAVGRLPVSPQLLTVCALGYGVVCLWFLARFLWRCAGLRVLRHEAVGFPADTDGTRFALQCAQGLGLSQDTLAASTRIFSPVAMGIRRRLILLPAAMMSRLTEPDLRAVIAHECAHLSRNDFLKNLLYEALAIPITYHPLLWATRERLTESREMVCDQMACADHGRKEYARSLLRLATVLVERTPAKTCHALGIFDANTFERRLMKLTEKPTEMGGVRRAVLVLACTVLGLAACGSAFALHLHVNALAAAALDEKGPSKPIAVAPGVMAAQKISGPNPIYPPDAKKARVQGEVVLDAVIGKDGKVENLNVVSGPPMLQSSSIEAVRQWIYKPFLLNGDPVEVRTSIHVIYSLKK
jgi:TonB family protein